MRIERMPNPDARPRAAPPGRDEPARWDDDAPAGPRRIQLHRPQPARDVPYVPTEQPVVDAALRMAAVTAGDVVYDLGCGDGRLVIAAARLGARAVGVDIDLQRIRECYWNAKRAGVGGGDRARFIRGSLFDLDLREASVVTLYLLTCLNIRLRPKLFDELRPGSRVVSNFFDMGDWLPDAKLETHGRTLYLWVMPAWVAGRWNCVVNTPGGRERMILRLRRRYQTVAGTARLGGKDVPVADGRLLGDLLTFTLPDPRRAGRGIRLSGKVDGRLMRGSSRADCGIEDEPVAWGGAWAGGS